MSELDEFVEWIARRQNQGRERFDGLGYGTLTAARDMFRAERATGRPFDRWVDAYEALYPRPAPSSAPLEERA